MTRPERATGPGRRVPAGRLDGTARTVAPGSVHLVAKNVSFSHPGRLVVDRVTLRAHAGERLGVVGENGAGKTTLLHLLAGSLTPSTGAVHRSGSVTVVDQELLFPVGTRVGDLVDAALAACHAAASEIQHAVDTFDHATGDLTALGAALARLEQLAAWDGPRRADEALTRFGAPRDLDRELAALSVGERFRVRLACAVAERSDLLLLDEPTNHLDAAGIEHLTEVIGTWAGAVLVVTHDRRLLDDVMTGIVDLDPTIDGRPAVYGATSYATYRFTKEQAVRRWRQRYAAQVKRAEQLAERLDASYEGLSDEWRPPKGSQKNRRATHARIHVKAADRLVEKLKAEAVEVPVPPRGLVFPDLPIAPEHHEPGFGLLELRAPAVRGRLDLPGMRLDLPPCGRLLVTGPNGSGKSTLLGALAGTVPMERGSRRLAPGVRVGLLGQDDATFSRLLAARPRAGRPDARDRAGADDVGPTGFEAYARRALDLLDANELDPDRLVPVAALGLLDEEDLDRPLAHLSVGQRRRFELACALLAAPHVLILDEPTNHLSVGLVDELTAALRLTSGAVVVATHDRAMRAELADWPELEL